MTTTDRPVAVEVDGLTIRYGERVAVDNVTFSAEAGAITALLGPNGAGKTSTVEALEGYRRPAAGTVRVLGLDPMADRAALTPRIGVMLQDGGLYPSLSPRDAVALFGSFYDRPIPGPDLLDRVGLAAVATTPCRRLSGGEQRRLSLALALIGRPEVAFLDEPTAGVDPRGRLAMREMVSGLRDEGVAVLMTTHDLEEAERLADRVVIIDAGRIVADGTPDAIRGAEAAAEIRFAAPPGLPADDLARHLGASVHEVQPGEYVIDISPDPRAVARLAAWLADRDVVLGDLRAGRPRLEDVFLRLTSDPGAPEIATGADRGRRRARSRR